MSKQTLIINTHLLLNNFGHCVTLRAFSHTPVKPEPGALLLNVVVHNMAGTANVPTLLLPTGDSRCSSTVSKTLQKQVRHRASPEAGANASRSERSQRLRFTGNGFGIVLFCSL